MKNLLRLVASSLLLLVACLAVTGGSVKADTVAPNPAHFFPGGDQTWLEIARNGGGVTLESPASWVKVFSLNPSATITVENAYYCSSTDYGGAVDTQYRAFKVTPRENLLSHYPSGVFELHADRSTGGASSCGSMTINIDGMTKSEVPGHNGYYVALLKVDAKDANVSGEDEELKGKIQRFKVHGNFSTSVGYWDQGKIERTNGEIVDLNNPFDDSRPTSAIGLATAFALQAPTVSDQSMMLRFAPNCDLGADRTAYLKWFDADLGEVNEDGVLHFNLWEIDNATGERTHIKYVAGLEDLGGQDDYRASSFTVKANHSYEWIWEDVGSKNGIQFWMPFDSFNFQRNCPTSLGKGGVQMTKYEGSSGPDINGHATGPIASGSPIGNNPLCIWNETGDIVGGSCTGDNPHTVFNKPDALGAGWYYTKLDPPSGWRVKAARYIYGTNFSAPYGTVDVVDNVVWFYLGGPFFANQTLFLDLYYEEGEPGQLSCTVDPLNDSPEPGQSFDVEITYNWTGSGDVDPVGLLNISEGAASSGIVQILGIDFGFPAKSASKTVTIANGVPAGRYNVRGRVAIPSRGISVDCQDEANLPRLPVANKPYVKFYGNDVIAGGAFAEGVDGTCGGPFNEQAGINTFARFTSNNYSGSSVQFAAFALGEINEFFSAGRRNGIGVPNPATDLTFGNLATTGRLGFDEKPGDSGIWRCIPDYFAQASAAEVENGDRTIASRGSSEIRYIEGDVYINGNIDLPSFANVSGIRNYWLVVKGDIYIDGDVDRLEGVYVAQPDGDDNGGTIYTCANGFRDIPDASSLYNDCNNKLTVNGAFIAKRVKLLRASGTLRNSVANEGPGPNNRAAEEFNFLPQLYLRAPNGLTERNVEQNYDFITSLPPIL